MVDVKSTAWKKAMQGVKKGNSKTIMKIEEKRGVIRVIKNKDIPEEEDTTVVDPDKLEGKTVEEKKEIKRMLRKFWTHIQKAHERRHVWQASWGVYQWCWSQTTISRLLKRELA